VPHAAAAALIEQRICVKFNLKAVKTTAENHMLLKAMTPWVKGQHSEGSSDLKMEECQWMGMGILADQLQN
jgi:hypothetical protein